MMTLARASLALIAIITVGLSVPAQNVKKEQDASNVTFGKGDGAKGIQFDDDFGLIFVQVRVNGSEPLWFILDTGFDTNIISADLTKELGIKLIDSQMVPQPGGAIEMGKAQGLKLSLEGVTLDGESAMTAPLAQMQHFVGHSFSGILGHDFISKFVLEIDYGKKIINLYDPAGYRYAGNGESIPVTVIAKEPFVNAFIVQPGRAPIPGKFKIDTGSTDTIGLNNNYLQANRVLAKGQKRLSESGVASGGDTEGFKFRISGFQIGKYLLEDLVIGVTTDSDGFENRPDAGTFGAQILSRFNVIIDYTRDRMILEKRSERFGAPFENDMSGLRLVTKPEDFGVITVKEVYANSPAFEAGVKAGDVIIELNGEPAAKNGLDGASRLLKSKPGSVLGIKYKRGESINTTRITLRRMI